MFGSIRALARLGLVTAALCPVTLAAVTIKQSNSKLTLKGDDAVDVIVLSGADAVGEIHVQLGSELVGKFKGIRDIDVRTAGGDDVVDIRGVKIGGSLRVRTEGGNDDVELHNTDRLLVDACVFIGRNLELNLGGQEGDDFEIEPSSNEFPITIGRTLSVRGAAHVDLDGLGVEFASEPGDVLIGGNLEIRTTSTSASTLSIRILRIDDVAVGGNSKWTFGSTVDEVRVQESAFVGKVKVSLGAGDDVFTIGGTTHGSAFASAVELAGGSGTEDALDLGTAVFATPPKVKQFELVD